MWVAARQKSAICLPHGQIKKIGEEGEKKK